MPIGNPPDLIGILVLLLATVTTNDMAAALGPYAAIFIAACGGAIFKLSGVEDAQMGQVKRYKFIAGRVLIATIASVGIAVGLAAVVPWAKPSITIVPIAAVIGYDPMLLFRFIGDIISKWTTKQAEK